MIHIAAVALLLTACSPGTWTVQTWGEDYIEAGIPAADFADGCAVTYDRFAVAFTEVALRDANGDDAAALAGPHSYDLTTPGPTVVDRLEAPPGHYDAVFVVIAPPDGDQAGNTALAPGASVEASGTLTCPGGAATFAWTFSDETAYACEPEGFTLGAGGEATTEVTVHGDHLWYDSLVAEDAQLRGELILAADADADGVIRQAELAAVPIAPTGLDVGPYSAVTTLADYVAHLARTVGHIDGEGHCETDLL